MNTQKVLDAAKALAEDGLPADFVRINETPEQKAANVLDRWPGRSGKGDAFPLALARPAARSMAPALRGYRVVLLGRSVASLFGLGGTPFFEWRGRLVAAPHPSGVSRWWNDPANVRRAEQFWRSL